MSLDCTVKVAVVETLNMALAEFCDPSIALMVWDPMLAPDGILNVAEKAPVGPVTGLAGLVG